MFNSDKPLSHKQFFQLATWFEGSLVVLAYIIGWLAEIDPLASLRFDLPTLGYGVLGTIPLYLAFTLTFQAENLELQAIRRFLIDQMGPVLASASMFQLIYLALLAGITEEILFRGVLQPLLEAHSGWVGGLILSNLMFAMAHAITKLYALLAALTGIYLGLTLDLAGQRSLGTPIMIHALYDFLAFLAVARAYQTARGREF